MRVMSTLTRPSAARNRSGASGSRIRGFAAARDFPLAAPQSLVGFGTRGICELIPLSSWASGSSQEVVPMSRSLTLPDELFNKLAQGAAQRGLTVEALLAFVSELVLMPDQPTERDRERSRRVERLLAKYRAGPLTEQDRADLDRLIDVD